MAQVKTERMKVVALYLNPDGTVRADVEKPAGGPNPTPMPAGARHALDNLPFAGHPTLGTEIDVTYNTVTPAAASKSNG